MRNFNMPDPPIDKPNDDEGLPHPPGTPIKP